MAEFILKDWYGKEKTFDHDTIYVRGKDGKLMPFTFGTGNPVLESLEVTENGTYTAPDGVDGFDSVTVNVDPTKITLLSEQEINGFAFDSSFGYALLVNPSPFELAIGKKYTVMWDGTEYSCTAYDGSAALDLDNVVYIGNGSAFDQPSNGEPFAILYVSGVGVVSALSDAAESHRIGIYQKGSGGSSDDVRYVTFMSHDGLIEYGKKAVAVGDDCADPITRGVFATPTRESDAQYNYTFYGWATTPNGGADADALKAVAEDKTVYANFSSTVRYYTITYYDDDGTTVLNTQSVAYGSVPSYTPTKSGVDFDGWNPEPVAVTGDASYVATWREEFIFATASWARIAEIAESGEVEKYVSLGDKKPLTFTSIDGKTYTVNMEVCGINHDVVYGGATVGISLMAETVAGYGRKHSSTESGFEWNGCELKTKMADVLSSFPPELQSVIKTVQKRYGFYNTSSSSGAVGISYDKVWIPSAAELGFTGSTSSLSNYVVGDGTAYAKYTRKKADSNGTLQDYWVRTGRNNKNVNWASYVKTDGYCYNVSPSMTLGLVIGFCI